MDRRLLWQRHLTLYLFRYSFPSDGLPSWCDEGTATACGSAFAIVAVEFPIVGCPIAYVKGHLAKKGSVSIRVGNDFACHGTNVPALVRPILFSGDSLKLFALA